VHSDEEEEQQESDRSVCYEACCINVQHHHCQLFFLVDLHTFQQQPDNLFCYGLSYSPSFDHKGTMIS
jgi:hypothetical protein